MNGVLGRSDLVQENALELYVRSYGHGDIGKDSGWVEDIATIVLLGPLVDDGFVVEGVIQ